MERSSEALPPLAVSDLGSSIASERPRDQLLYPSLCSRASGEHAALRGEGHSRGGRKHEYTYLGGKALLA